MTTYEKLEVAKGLLSEVNSAWDEDNVMDYSAGMSFDELIREIRGVQLMEERTKYETAIPKLDGKSREEIQEDVLLAWVPEEKREQARRDLKTLGYCVYGVEAVNEFWGKIEQQKLVTDGLWHIKERLTDSLEARA